MLYSKAAHRKRRVIAKLFTLINKRDKAQAIPACKNLDKA